jgi:hypothetical protein
MSIRRALVAAMLSALALPALAQSPAAPPAAGVSEAESLYTRGMAMLNGKEVPKDVAQGKALLEKSASLGYGPAFTGLGVMLNSLDKANGRQELMLWLGRGAFRGEPKAQGMLGVIFAGKEQKGSSITTALYQVAAESDPKMVELQKMDPGSTNKLVRMEADAFADQIRAQVKANKSTPLPLRFVPDGVVERNSAGVPTMVEAYATYVRFSGGRGESCDKPAVLATRVYSPMVAAGVQRNWLAGAWPGSVELGHSTRATKDMKGQYSVYRIRTAQGSEREVCIDITPSLVMMQKQVISGSFTLGAMSRCGAITDDNKRLGCLKGVYDAVQACGAVVSIPETMQGIEGAAGPTNAMTQCVGAREEVAAYPVNLQGRAK